MHILFPGRHHLLTDFQFKYLYSIIQTGLSKVLDINGTQLNITEPVTDIIFAVTSSNYSNTRRNPIPFYLRTIALDSFADELGIDSYIFGIDDVGQLNDFAKYTIKKIAHESDGRFHLNKDNTVVVCSTPVMEMYLNNGFRILPAELVDKNQWAYSTETPWDIVEHVANIGKGWENDHKFLHKAHISTIKMWKRYGIGTKIQTLFNDFVIGDDGDITSTRDYNSYVRQMDEIAELKFKDTLPYIRPGRIGDIGCAAGSWIKLACKEEKFRESDLYGVEVTRFLFDLCQQRKHNGEFANPNVFFSRKNAITEPVFEHHSMNTIHTSSLTHEIESYGGRDDLLKFIQNRYDELGNGGVWINRDVVGPENGDESIYLYLSTTDGNYTERIEKPLDRDQLSKYLSELCTYSRFLCFARDFRKNEGYELKYEKCIINGRKLIKLKLSDACEFATKKDYTDNWQSEMHETFCFWSFSEWKKQLTHIGFRVLDESKVYTNKWIVDNRWKDHLRFLKLDDGQLSEIDDPLTNMITVCEKI